MDLHQTLTPACYRARHCKAHSRSWLTCNMRAFRNISNISIALILVVMAIVSSNLNWGRNFWRGILEADAKGYYAYLPAVFIYKDLNFGFFDAVEKDKYYDENLFYDYRMGANGQTINKYYAGTALAELPFFLIAHATSAALGFEPDGYSKPYPVLITVAALFYLLVGLVFLNRFLKTYALKEWQRGLTLMAAVFGTHLFYYTVVEPGMSHVYSFAFICMFLYFSRSFFSSFHKNHIPLLAAILAIVILIRPVNALIVFILPFVAGDRETFKNGLAAVLQDKLTLAIGFGVFLAILSIQPIIYKLSAGSFFVYSYGTESFNFLSPHLFDILFSYRKGLFLYTPLLLLSLTGGYFLWKSSRYAFYAWFGFLVLITYVFSSWWMWYYGGSFSSRVYVEYIPLFMVLLALSLKGIRSKRARHLYVTLIVLLVVVCQVQTYQYRYYQIHWSDMTKEKYWNVFLRIDRLMK